MKRYNLGIAALFLVLAVVQLTLFVREVPASGGWFLFGTDTLFHDAVVHIRIQQFLWADPTIVPLWMPELHGGLPSLGAWLWTPFSPFLWPMSFLPYHWAQWIAWVTALWVSGLGAYAAARALQLKGYAAVFAGVTWMLAGHVVTLIHAGHFQKVAALAWLGWALAGAVWMTQRSSIGDKSKGVTIYSASIGMMFLCGHPQIAYTGLVLGALWTAVAFARPRVRRQWWWTALFPVAVGLGFAFGAAQLLPGLEMSGLSNRSSGVQFEEAVNTSYPPGELLEFAIPRVKGSSVRGDEYTGQWGERIVSDYIGKVALLLALLSILTWRRRWLPLLALWFMVAAALLVGVGRHTPVYGWLYHYLPGFASFRSPGTFMAPASLALAMLAGFGMEGLIRNLGRQQIVMIALPVLLIFQAGDLMIANRHFLFAHSWTEYQTRYLAPTMIDVWIQEDNRGLETFFADSPLNLRPMLFGGRSPNGYHPITFLEKEKQDQHFGYNTPEWFDHLGVRYLATRSQVDALESNLVQQFPDTGIRIYELPEMGGHVAPNIQAEWNQRSANVRDVTVHLEEPADITLKDTVTKDWAYVGLGNFSEPEGPELSTVIRNLPAGTHRIRFEYRPFAYRLGCFLSAIAFGLFLLLTRVRSLRKAPSRHGPSSLPLQ